MRATQDCKRSPRIARKTAVTEINAEPRALLLGDLAPAPNLAPGSVSPHRPQSPVLSPQPHRGDLLAAFAGLQSECEDGMKREQRGRVCWRLPTGEPAPLRAGSEQPKAPTCFPCTRGTFPHPVQQTHLQSDLSRHQHATHHAVSTLPLPLKQTHTRFLQPISASSTPCPVPCWCPSSVRAAGSAQRCSPLPRPAGAPSVCAPKGKHLGVTAAITCLPGEGA